MFQLIDWLLVTFCKCVYGQLACDSHTLHLCIQDGEYLEGDVPEGEAPEEVEGTEVEYVEEVEENGTAAENEEWGGEDTEGALWNLHSFYLVPSPCATHQWFLT